MPIVRNSQPPSPEVAAVIAKARAGLPLTPDEQQLLARELDPLAALKQSAAPVLDDEGEDLYT